MYGPFPEKLQNYFVYQTPTLFYFHFRKQVAYATEGTAMRKTIY